MLFYIVAREISRILKSRVQVESWYFAIGDKNIRTRCCACIYMQSGTEIE